MIDLSLLESLFHCNNRALKNLATKLAWITFDAVYMYCNIMYVNYVQPTLSFLYDTTKISLSIRLRFAKVSYFISNRKRAMSGK